MQQIFVVEDDDNIREMLQYALGFAGFSVEGFSDAAALLQRLSHQMPSLLLLDIMLPEMDGLSTLRLLRLDKKTQHLPIIMLTAKGSELDRIRGLDMGADDYITKPFSVMEVISRIRAVLRRMPKATVQSTVKTIGNLSLDPEKRTVSVDEIPLVLTYKEFELLHYLILNAGFVLSREKLLNAVWGYHYIGESRTVDMHIKSLRKKLGSAGDMIKTVRNVGYKLEEMT